MRTINVEVMDIGDEAYLIDDIDYGTVKKTLITGARVTVEKPLVKPEVTYKVGDWDYFQPGRVFKTAKEAFDAVDAAQIIGPQ